jgi:dipeptidyl aminopeptidase/acylaminoacyl peptidase
MMAVVGDWGGEDYLDLMAAVDQVADRDYVDEDRLGVHGYSYGGYMTGWIVGHTNRFRAAVVGAPCIDLFSMYGTSDIGVSFGEVQWGNSPVDAAGEPLDRLAAQLLQRSPIAYAARVETPVLLLHGEADVRCPISQSEAYFTVLKRLGKEVELVRFPDCSHLFPRLGHPRMREEYLARTLAWFDDHL